MKMNGRELRTAWTVYEPTAEPAVYAIKVPVCPYCTEPHEHEPEFEPQYRDIILPAPCAPKYARHFASGDYLLKRADDFVMEVLEAHVLHHKTPWRIDGRDGHPVSYHHSISNAMIALRKLRQLDPWATLKSNRLEIMAMIFDCASCDDEE